MKLPPPLPWPADLSCHPCLRGEHGKCRGFVMVAPNGSDKEERRQCSHQGPTCPEARR